MTDKNQAVRERLATRIVGPGVFAPVAAARPTVEDDTEPCGHCQRPTYWDYAEDRRRHAVDPERGCFLIPAEAAGCDRPGTIQFVYVDASGLNRVTKPQCFVCSDRAQPSEPVQQLRTYGRHACAGEVSYL